MPVRRAHRGTFTAGAKAITLYSTTASANSQHLLGKYKYLVQGAKFSLSRKDFATNSPCGADKPYMTLSVSSPAGDNKYVDSFYSCHGGDNVYIDNIGGVFGALRDAAGL